MQKSCSNAALIFIDFQLLLFVEIICTDYLHVQFQQYKIYVTILRELRR